MPYYGSTYLLGMALVDVDKNISIAEYIHLNAVVV